MQIYIGSDHNGFYLAQQLRAYIRKAGYTVTQEESQTYNPDDDFPIVAQKTAHDVVSGGHTSRGILLCGSGQGVCIAANRFKGIRAILGYDHESVRSARHDDDANILCLPARSLSFDQATALVDVFLQTAFTAAPRYKRRIAEIDHYAG